MLLHVFYII